MNAVRSRQGIFVLICLLMAGCSGKNASEPSLVGHWSGDMSAEAIASRIAQLKSDYPQETRTVMMETVTNMGLISLDFRGNGTVTAVHQKTTYQGNWKYDATRKDVELDLIQTDPKPVTIGEGTAEEPQRTAWIANFDLNKETLELFMNDREAREYYLRVAPGKRSGIFVLKKKK